MLEPIWSIEVDLWLIYADYLSDQDDVAGEARARRIAETLASGRTGLWLQYGGALDASILSCLHEPGEDGLDRADGYSWIGMSEARMLTQHLDRYEPLNPTLRPKSFQRCPDLARAFFDKLAELGPFLWLAPDNPTVAVPCEVAVCPECGGALEGHVEEWLEETGEPAAVMLDCVASWPSLPPRQHHDWHQADWQPIRDKVERWARNHVRIQAEEAAKS